jgi:hypothetical protein
MAIKYLSKMVLRISLYQTQSVDGCQLRLDIASLCLNSLKVSDKKHAEVGLKSNSSGFIPSIRKCLTFCRVCTKIAV